MLFRQLRLHFCRRQHRCPTTNNDAEVSKIKLALIAMHELLLVPLGRLDDGIGSQ